MNVATGDENGHQLCTKPPSGMLFGSPNPLTHNLAVGSRRERVSFANSGGEANEGAVRLARNWGAVHRRGANEIVTTVHAFHGRTLATMFTSGTWPYRARMTCAAGLNRKKNSTNGLSIGRKPVCSTAWLNMI